MTASDSKPVLRTLSFWAVVLIAVALIVFFAEEMVSAA